MDLRRHLLDAFDYDLWANRRWLGPARLIERYDVFSHILRAQENWIARVKERPAQEIETPFEAHLTRLHKEWKELLTNGDLDQEVTYGNSTGKTFTNNLAEIALHVLNHGTYHRGELRGYAGAANIEFLETDRIVWLRELAGKV